MTDLELMEAAIAQARKSLSEGGIPIGSALARNGELLAVGHNKRVQNADPVTHAEIDCLRNAGRIGSFRDTVLYSTLMRVISAAAGGRAVRYSEGDLGRTPHFSRRAGIHAEPRSGSGQTSICRSASK